MAPSTHAAALFETIILPLVCPGALYNIALKKILKLDVGKPMMYASWNYLFLSMMRVTKHLHVNMYAEHAIIAVDLYTVVKIQLQPVLSFTTSPLLQFDV
ncbi:hypothetical protein T02_12886 [Trichinella nativa]|uniref:Uncharacterized protein n=1 Tax=Trichinella nativa TaxID=6335 RepID=A0A0V1L5X9_9BILA|nr:hypothetical protein T02_12886 [Trichinella nativa]